MRFIQTFQLYDFLDTLVSLMTAFVLGTLIGAERQYRQRSAGLRTNVLVAVGASAFVDLADHLAGAEGAVRVIAYVVSGIGFLGAGAIMKEGMNVRGLNTAATLWASAAVGCCAGADMIAQAGLLTLFVLAGNTLLRPLVNAIDRIPINEQTSEASYDVMVTTDSSSVASVREILLEKLAVPIIRCEIPTSSIGPPTTPKSSPRWSACRSNRMNSTRSSPAWKACPAFVTPPGMSARSNSEPWLAIAMAAEHRARRWASPL